MTLRLARAVSLLSLVAAAAWGQANNLQLQLATPSVFGVGIPVVIQWRTSGGTPPYTYALAAGTIPPGMVFENDIPDLTGTPTAIGTYPVTISVTDSTGTIAYYSINMKVQPALAISTATLPAATAGVSYAERLSASGGGLPVTWAITGGTLPPGFRLDAAGIVGGIPATPGTYTFTAAATDWQGTSVSRQLSITVAPRASAPTFTADSVVNGASFAAGISPGSYATIRGTDLAASSGAASTPTLPESLDGVSVTIAGKPAKLLAVSPQQINFQVPFDLAAGAAPLQVVRDGIASTIVNVNINAAAPGIFLSGAGRVFAINQDGTINSPSNPAAPGSVVVLYATGAGAFEKPLDYGGVAPASSLVNLRGPVTVTIGGAAARVLFAGAAPSQGTGLVQLNIQVPQLTPGDYAVKLTAAGADSNTPLLSVR